MVQSMAAVPQPKFLADWVAGFGSFVTGHAFAVNLFAVAALAVTGLAFATGRRRLIRPAITGFTLLCLADWVLVQDFGFFGGLGTDPNSMIPFALLAVAGYLALDSVPARDRDPSPRRGGAVRPTFRRDPAAARSRRTAGRRLPGLRVPPPVAFGQADLEQDRITGLTDCAAGTDGYAPDVLAYCGGGVMRRFLFPATIFTAVCTAFLAVPAAALPAAASPGLAGPPGASAGGRRGPDAFGELAAGPAAVCRGW